MAGCLEDPVQVKLWQASTGTLRIKMVFPLRWHAQLYIRRGTRIPAVIYSDEITYLLIHSAISSPTSPSPGTFTPECGAFEDRTVLCLTRLARCLCTIGGGAGFVDRVRSWLVIAAVLVSIWLCWCSPPSSLVL